MGYSGPRVMVRASARRKGVMKFEEYHEHTGDTAVYSGVGTGNWTALAYTALGLSGEAGEVANQIKKINRDDNEILSIARQEKLASELGDVFWYLSRLMHEAGIDPASVMAHNFQKLWKRQREGTLWGDGEDRAPKFIPAKGWRVRFIPAKGNLIGQNIERVFYAQTEAEAQAQLEKVYGSRSLILKVRSHDDTTEE